MSRRTPPLNALRAFDIVARLQNLTAAAQVLHVSQSAVSRQIGALETYLGVELFKRERRGVALTRAGTEYARRIAPAFDEISLATEHLLENRVHVVLRVRTYTTFAGKWLIPRLRDFQAHYPDIEVVVSNAVEDVDFDRDEVDVAIQFGHGRWPRMHSDFLFADDIEPVCSPEYQARLTSKSGRVEDVLKGTLLISRYRKSDWRDWLAANALVENAVRSEQMQFSSSILTWQAAVDGLGIAIGQNALLQSELSKGTLVRPFGQTLRRPLSYFLVSPQTQRFCRRVSVFRDWLLETTRRERDVLTTGQAADATIVHSPGHHVA